MENFSLPHRLKLAAQLVTVAVTLLTITFFLPGVFHNAAHDTRHTLAIPCH